SNFNCHVWLLQYLYFYITFIDCIRNKNRCKVFLHYMKGNLNPLPFLPLPMFDICFIIFFISANCFNKRLTCDTFVPEPLAILFLRLAPMISGSLRSFFVID